MTGEAGVVVAGAGGYLGGRLVRALVAGGAGVVALVRKQRPWLALAGVEQVEVDLRQPSTALDAALDGSGALVHLAGPSEVHAAADPAAVLADTVAITTELAAAAARAGVARVVYLSTVHVYGARAEPGAVLTEDLRPEPRHPYAIARLASEHALRGLGLDPVCLRLTNSVGAPADVEVDRWTLVVNDLCRQAAVSGELRLRTDGLQWRDFIALDDAVGIVAAVVAGAAPPGTWNLGTGTATTVRDVASLVADAFEAATGARPPLHAPPAGGDAPAPYRVDVSGLAGFGLSASTPLRSAVEQTARFCIEHRDALRRLAS